MVQTNQDKDINDYVVLDFLTYKEPGMKPYDLMDYKDNFKEMDESTKVVPFLNVERLCEQHYDDKYYFILVKY